MIVRPATTDDLPSLVEFIGELAAYEREADAVEIDQRMLADSLFADAPLVFANVADDDGVVVGMTIYFRNFSTWTGRSGIYLEDFYVRPESRGHGVGRALMGALAEEARSDGHARIDWSVLDWNENAIRFYRSLGAVPMDGWTGYRLSGPALAELGSTGHKSA